MIFLITWWNDPWNQFVMSSDASEGGLALVGFLFSRSSVAEVTYYGAKWVAVDAVRRGWGSCSLSILFWARRGRWFGCNVLKMQRIQRRNVLKTQDFPEVAWCMLDLSRWKQLAAQHDSILIIPAYLRAEHL